MINTHLRTSPSRTIFALLLCLAATTACALDDLRFDIGPNDSVNGGMGKVVGMATVTISTTTKAPTWSIVSPIQTTFDPTVLWKAQPPADPCPNDSAKFRTYSWIAAPNHANSVMQATFKGSLAPCAGSGSGNAAKFDALVVHADLDVDSDNSTWDTPPTSPDLSSIPEDAMEDIKYKQALYVLKNPAYEESGKKPGDPADKPTYDDREPDHKRDGIVLADPDLPRAILTILGKDGDATFTFPSTIRLWKTDLSEVKTGTAISVPTGQTELRIEGVSESSAIASDSLKVVFKPKGGLQDAKDEIVYTTVELALLSLHVPVTDNTDSTANNMEFGAETKKFAFAPNNANKSRILVMVKAQLKPALSADEAEKLFGSSGSTERLTFEASAIDDSHGAQKNVRIKWSTPTTDKVRAKIDFKSKKEYDPATGIIKTWVRFLDLPAVNSDFGKKELSMKFRGRLFDKKPFEVYFHPNATDHHFDPKTVTGGHGNNIKVSQNWFYYWSRLRAGTTDSVCSYSYGGDKPAVLFDAAGLGFGRQKGATLWLHAPVVTPNTQASGFDAASAFSGGNVMNGSFILIDGPNAKYPQLEAAQAQASWKCDTAPDLANISFAHESAHYRIELIRKGSLNEDKDSIPDALEDQVGLLHNVRNIGNVIQGPENAHSYPAFNGSQGSGVSPDEEFYCWINGCFGATSKKDYKHKPMKTAANQQLVLQPYNNGYTQAGEPLPTVANNEFDWSVGGKNWVAP